MGHSEWYDRFPYEVHIDPDVDRDTYNNRYKWLETHVGERDLTWCYPNTALVRFKLESDAIRFSLTWS
jgi:hypothetical protein